MNYFFELLESYKHRGCCVTRIDEKAKPKQANQIPLAQDPRLQSLADFIKNPPETATITPSKSHTNATTVNDTRLARSFSVDANGMFIGGTDASNRGILTTLFGALEGEEEQPSQEQPAQEQPQQQPMQPMLTPEELEAQREVMIRDANYQKADVNIRDIVSQYDKEAECRAQIRFDTLTNDLRPDREKDPKVTAKFLKSRLGYKNVSTSFAQQFSNTFKEFYKNQKLSSCEFINNVLKLTNDKKLLEPLTKLYLNGSVNQSLINMTSLQENSIRQSIEFASDDKIAESFSKLLDGSCEPGQVCVPEEGITDMDKKALAESFVAFTELAKKPKLSADEKILLTSLLRLTDDRRIALAGVTMMDSIIIQDRGRSFLDLVRFVERKHGVTFDTINLIGKLNQDGSENQAIGTLFEHWTKIVGLVLAKTKASPDDQAKIDLVINSYVAKVGDVCKIMNMIDKRIRALGQTSGGIPMEAYEDLAEVKHDSISCSEMADINRILTSRVTRSFAKVGTPDAVVQTGTTTGKGERADVVMSFDDVGAARQAARKAGMNPSTAVKAMTMEQLLDKNPEFKTMIIAAGLNQPGQPYDFSKKVYTMKMGLKTSSGKGSSSVATGSASLESMSEDIVAFSQGGSSDWVKNTAKSLGLRDREAAGRLAKFIQKDLAKAESIIDSALPKVNIKGGSENTAKLTATQIMDAITAQNVDGENKAKDEIFALAQTFAKESGKMNPDSEILDRLKLRLKEATKRRLLEDKIGKFLDSDDIKDREAGALLLGLVGGVNSDQPIHYIDLNSDKQYIGDHNTLAVSPLRGLITGEEGYSYGITRSSKAFRVSLTTPTNATIAINFTGRGSGATNASSSITKSAMEELVNLTEDFAIDKNILATLDKLLGIQKYLFERLSH